MFEINAVAFVLFHPMHLVLVEKCPKKAKLFGHETWFIPGGKIEAGESSRQAMMREMREELGITPTKFTQMPVLEGAPYFLGSKEHYWLAPYLVKEYEGKVPYSTLDQCVPLAWIPTKELLSSPVIQIRMMIAGAMGV